MPHRGHHGWLPLVGLAICLGGCSSSAPTPFVRWSKREVPHAPAANSGNAFDGYILAAREAEVAAGDLGAFVSFEGRHKRQLMSRIEPAFSRFQRAARQPCTFQFEPSSPFELNPEYRGLRLLRLSCLWQLQEAVAKGNFEEAVRLAVLGTKVGFDFVGGGSMDADFGLQFADDVRREVAPILGQLTVPQLARLTSGLKSGLGRLPTFESIARNEHSNFLEGVQWIQDRYEKREFDKIDEMLGTPVRDATTYLKQIPQDDFKRRSSYFQGFADEAELVADWTAAESTKPVLKRKDPKSIPYAAERPWRRYAAQLFTSLTPVQARYDATLSRTRMLILASEINRQIKVSRRAPKTLGAFSLPLRTDPITGSEFKYRATGMEFYLYSVGLNFQDDQGQTDSVFSSPDMTLETAVD